jgi:hypothetical protein
LTLKPAFALVSMNRTPCSFALASPSSVDTCLVATFRWTDRIKWAQRQQGKWVSTSYWLLQYDIRFPCFFSNLNELMLLLSKVQSKWIGDTRTSGQPGLFYSRRGWWARRHLFPCLLHRSTSMYAEMIACLQTKMDKFVVARWWYRLVIFMVEVITETKHPQLKYWKLWTFIFSLLDSMFGYEDCLETNAVIQNLASVTVIYIYIILWWQIDKVTHQ